MPRGFNPAFAQITCPKYDGYYQWEMGIPEMIELRTGPVAISFAKKNHCHDVERQTGEFHRRNVHLRKLQPG